MSFLLLEWAFANNRDGRYDAFLQPYASHAAAWNRERRFRMGAWCWLKGWR